MVNTVKKHNEYLEQEQHNATLNTKIYCQYLWNIGNGKVYNI